MLTITDKSLCSGCTACVNVCPQKCIHMQPDDEGFEYPQVDAARCTNCHLCENLCEKSPPPPGQIPTLAYAAKALSAELRMASSSGGLFTLLAQWVIGQGGAVYGAAAGPDASVQHIRVTSTDELDALRRSKYLQSRVGTALHQARQDLEAGRWVLFTGTPCQIGGLQNFLGPRVFPTLLCQDIVCHGVPPYKAWKKYLSEKGFSGSARFSFRDKTSGWASYAIHLSQPGHTLTLPGRKCAYIRAFLADIMLRPSCYHCHYKNMGYHGDITLGDFWGIEQALPDFSDDVGVSLVFVNTAKGQAALEQISSALALRPVPVEDARRGNATAIAGARPHPNRSLFFSQMDTRRFEWLVTKYVKGSLLSRALRRVGNKIKSN